MDLTNFILRIRFLFSDTDISNQVYRENLTTRPGNMIDGNNKTLYLMNRRIAAVNSIYSEDNQLIDPLTYTLTPQSGMIQFATAPVSMLYADYTWQKLTDAEITEAINQAAASGNFDPNNIIAGQLDYCSLYALAYCYLSAASRAGEYYTLSVAGKQVSKSELFNHYSQLHQNAMTQALNMRTDARKDRGDRDIPADAIATPNWAQPYLGGSSE